MKEKEWYAKNSTYKRQKRRERYWTNPEREKANSRQWRLQNPDKQSAASRRWIENNPDQIRILWKKNGALRRNAEGKFTKEDVARILREQKRKCAYCRKLLDSKYHLDHIHPITKGGSNFPRNLQLTCATCNKNKFTKDPIEFAQSLGMLL